MTDIVLFLASILLGFLAGNRYFNKCRKRYVLYCDLERFALYLSQNTKTKCQTIPSIYENIKGSFSQDFQELYENCFVQNKACQNFTLEERVEIDNFYIGIKQTSAHLVSNCADQYSGVFCSLKNKYNQIKSTKGVAMQKLGVLCGVCFGLLII